MFFTLEMVPPPIRDLKQAPIPKVQLAFDGER